MTLVNGPLRRLALAIALAFGLGSLGVPAGAQPYKPIDGSPELYNALSLIYKSSPNSNWALDWILARGKADMVPHLIASMRYSRLGESRLDKAIRQLTGETQRRDWFDWMLWQQAHPELKWHESFPEFKSAVLFGLDRDFRRFIVPDQEYDIRIEEITWGGVPVDGIPPLDNPEFLDAADAGYLLDSDDVFGVEINGDARAYPLRIMGWHEMFNDVIGGVPVSLAYCTLCGAGILFEGDHPALKELGVSKPLTFSSSGLLYRSNKLMYDRNTDSLWNQFTGEPIGGALRGSGIKLAIRPVVITSWENWRKKHPTTKVLSLETGFHRDYGSGVVYQDYFESQSIMFPVLGGKDGPLGQKDQVYGMRLEGGNKAWPLAAFDGGRVINDQVGSVKVVLIGDAATRTVRAYVRGNRNFVKAPGGDLKTVAGETWVEAEAHLVGPDGRRLSRLPGHISYWFAWAGYLGERSELFQE